MFTFTFVEITFLIVVACTEYANAIKQFVMN